ncbi:MAG: hypothetical protein KGQ66_11115 [Acidobacteriota bacterium]|nr:hypothetical protein [Acidobacteriota bacterium]
MVVLLVLVGACSSGAHRSDPTTTSSTAAPATSTAPVTPNPYVVPPVITPAYVDAVFKVLNHINGNAVRLLVASGAVTPQALSYLRSIYGDPLYSKEVTLATSSLKGDLANVRKPPGDVVTTVQRLIHASSSCIFVEISENYNAVLYRPGTPPSSGYWGLKEKSSQDDPHGLNPTPWVLFFNAVYMSPTVIPDQCV